MILVNNQLGTQFFMYVDFYSGMHRLPAYQTVIYIE